MKKILLILLVGIPLFSLQSCKTRQTITSQAADKQINIDGLWILQTLNNQNTKEIFKGQTPTININSADNKISGNGGCNQFNGRYSFSNNVFSAPNIATTIRMCSDDNQEAQFLSMLSKANITSLVDNMLTFHNDGRIVAQFVKGITETELSGKWYLDSMANADLSILFLTSGNIPTLNFDIQENRIGGNAGCNTYGATYQLGDTYISIGSIMSTRMACPNLEGENKFTEMLSGTSSITTNGDYLFLSKDGNKTLTFKKVK